MNTIGSHPGAILFRLSIMVVLIAIMVVVFFSYLENAQKELERTSILQTKKIIDSSLAVVFATYAVSGRLNELNQLAGGNPFEFLREYQILPAAYVGELERDPDADLESGWYYLSHRGVVVYKSFFINSNIFFSVVLNYEDIDQSGSFDANIDRFKNLQFRKLAES